MASSGVNAMQADVLVRQVFPAAKALKPGTRPTSTQKKALKDAMTEVVSLEL
jgi:hypothetical protein